ncbi:hypothetical protein PINS_up005450 [Pythium insidiosum]|nr:hypothetical protein PINS_up005450 [Pythium insidiosum]
MTRKTLYRDPFAQQHQAKKRKRSNDQTNSSSSQGDATRTELAATDLQSAIQHVLQTQQRLEEGVSQLSATIRDDQRTRQKETLTASEVALRTQNERLEQRHDALVRRCEAMERRVETLEREKGELHEQLVAAEAEVFAYRKTIQSIGPNLASTLTTAIENAARQQATASGMIETKLSLLHDILDDIRHASGERTEPDDSPQKRSGIFPDECQTTDPSHPVLYPQTVVRELENKLHLVLEANEELHHKVAMMENKLKRAETNAQRIRQLSLAWLEHEEETKG